MGRPLKPVIVLSHTPPQGLHEDGSSYHEGFNCFHEFIRLVKPILWLHGHIHLQSFTQMQTTRIEETLVVNVYEFKVMTIKDNDIEVGYQVG